MTPPLSWLARVLRSLPVRVESTVLRPLTLGERIGLGLPLVVVLVAIYRMGVPVLYWDEWNGYGGVLLEVYRHGLTPGLLWRPHNEHRIFLPRLLFLIDSRIDLSPVRLMFLSQLLLGLFFLLLLPMLRQAAKHLPERWHIAVYFLCSAFFFSFVQHENMFWGFQIAWNIEVLCIGLVVTGLLEHRPLRVAFGFALAYLSSAHFLTLVPLILLFEALRLQSTGSRPGMNPSRAWGRYLALVGALIVLVAAYLFHLPKPVPHPSRLYALAHPLEAVLYVLTQIGGPFWKLLPMLPYDVAAPFFGALHLGGCLMLLRARRFSQLGLEFWLILAMYGNTLLVMVGRLGLGVVQALSPRYTVLVLFGWLAWMAALLKSYPDTRWVRRLVFALLLLSLVPSLSELMNQATAYTPKRRTGQACLAEVLAAPDPYATAATRTECLQILYPEVDRLLEFATGLVHYQPVLGR
jgi:hypothetical protein